MLTLNETQWRRLQTHDDKQFTASVCDQFLADNPDMAQAPGRATVLARMGEARDLAARVNLVDPAHVVQLCYLVAQAPAILDNPRMAAYFQKPGATPEQRLDDLFAVMKYKLTEEPSIWPH